MNIIEKDLRFKENLKQLRAERQVSQSQLAEHLKTTVKTISHWETGYSKSSMSQILEIAQFFQISTDELLY